MGTTPIALFGEREELEAVEPQLPPGSGGALRVVMVVANDVTRDSRVLREAAALAAAGHRVTVLGMHTSRTTAPPVELRDGFVIHRLPFRAKPPGWWVPPNYRGRLRARVDRQLVIHGSRLAAFRRGMRRDMARARAAAWPPAPGWRRLTKVARPPRAVDAPVEYRRWRRPSATRAAFLRFVRSPVNAWPGKVARTTDRLGAEARRRVTDPSATVSALGRPALRGLVIVAALPVRVAGLAVRIARPYVAVVTLGIWGSSYLLANRLSGGAIEWLTGWRWRWLGWARFAAQHAPDADVWHGHDFTSLPAIVELKRQRGGFAVYDTHEIYLESGRHAGQPQWAKRWLERLERRLAGQVDAIVTVNQSLAEIVARRLGAPSVEVVYNCPERHRSLSAASPLREAAGIGPGTPLAVYHGSFSEHRGIEQLLEAMLLPPMDGVHVALLGHGSLQGWLTAEAAADRYAGRLHVVEGVPPDQLLDWLVGVDVAVAPIQPSTLNHWFSSPNKVFEAIAVGTPVAGSDFPEFRRVVADGPNGPLGVLFDPTDPANIAAAVRQLLDLPGAERADLRRRCRAEAERRWNWEIEAMRLIHVYDGLVERAARGVPVVEVAAA